MGHSTVRAAMIYQHLVGGRDQVIADHVDHQIKDAKAKSSAEQPKKKKDDGGKII